MIGNCKSRTPRMLIPSLVAVLLAPLWAAPAAAAIPSPERQALMALYESTDGPSWERRDGWGGPEGSEASWYGVVTDPGQSTVVALRLGDNGLAGPLPEALGGLPNLRELDLSGNRLEGPMPAALAGLRSLVRLDLTGNPVAGDQDALELLVSSATSAQDVVPQDGPAINGVQFKLRVENGVVVQCRLTLYGSGFEGGCEVHVNGQPAPKSIFESQGEVHAKGGAKLKKMLPKGQVHQLTVRNPDGQVSPAYPFTRP